MNDDELPPVAVLLDRAEAIKPELAAHIDRFNEVCARFQSSLSSLNLGVSASVDITTDWDAEQGWYSHLVFRKENGTWQLGVATGTDGTPEAERFTPMTGVSKEVRLGSFVYFQPLLHELIKSAEKQKKKAAEAIMYVEGLIEEIEAHRSAAKKGAEPTAAESEARARLELLRQATMGSPVAATAPKAKVVVETGGRPGTHTAVVRPGVKAR